MEKFSQFRDPFTGIHPFNNPKKKPINICNIYKLLYRIPLLFFIPLFPRLISFFITIEKPKRIKNKGVIVCNSVSFIDCLILKSIQENSKIFTKTKDGFLKQGLIGKGKIYKRLNRFDCNIVFLEECSSNNTCLVKFVDDIECDGVLGLRYSESCVNVYGNFLVFLLRFMLSDNYVKVLYEDSCDCKDLMKVTGLLQVKLGIKEKGEYMELVKRL